MRNALAWSLDLAILAKPKKRPRFATGQGAYHESSYAAWLGDARREVLLQWRRPPLDCPVMIDVAFAGPRRPRGDEDNLRGAVLDALGGSGRGDGIVLLDDRLCWGGSTIFTAAPDHLITVVIRMCDPPDYGPYRARRKRRHEESDMTIEGIHVGQMRYGDTVPGVPPERDVRRRGLALLALDLVAAVGAVAAAIRAYVTIEFDDAAGTISARRWAEVMQALRRLADLVNDQCAALSEEKTTDA